MGRTTEELAGVAEEAGVKPFVFASSGVVMETWRGSLGGRGERGRATLSLVEGSMTSL